MKKYLEKNILSPQVRKKSWWLKIKERTLKQEN